MDKEIRRKIFLKEYPNHHIGKTDIMLKHRKYLVEKRKEKITKRNLDIIKMRKERYKLREIGEKYGVSRERIRQILLASSPSTIPLPDGH